MEGGAAEGAGEGAERSAASALMVPQVVIVAGLLLVAAAFIQPFASNEADCLDHCADATSYFVWNPADNPGAPFLLVGVASSVVLWRSPRWRRRAVTWIGALSGWVGLFLYQYAPAYISEFRLYGGPMLELHAARWIIGYGWLILQVGTFLYASRSKRPGRPDSTVEPAA